MHVEHDDLFGMRRRVKCGRRTIPEGNQRNFIAGKGKKVTARSIEELR